MELNKKEIEHIVELIERIAEGKAAIAINKFCENADSAAHNATIVAGNVHRLIAILEHILT